MNFFNNKGKGTRRHIVNIDAYGNAIPDTPSLQDEDSSIASMIVGKREVILRPSKKPTATKTEGILVRLPLPLGLFGKRDKPQLPALQDENENGMIKQEYIPRQATEKSIAVPEFVELSMQRLHDEFQRREHQLESRFQQLREQHKLQASKRKRWLFPVILVGGLASGYVLYVLTNMQQAMYVMSGSIPAMNQHMGAMATDTRQMSNNMQVMNQSMYSLNGNVSQMNANVYHMNRQMGTMTRAIAPMGKAAKATRPFFSMFSKFMPF